MSSSYKGVPSRVSGWNIAARYATIRCCCVLSSSRGRHSPCGPECVRCRRHRMGTIEFDNRRFCLAPSGKYLKLKLAVTFCKRTCCHDCQLKHFRWSGHAAHCSHCARWLPRFSQRDVDLLYLGRPLIGFVSAAQITALNLKHLIGTT